MPEKPAAARAAAEHREISKADAQQGAVVEGVAVLKEFSNRERR